MFEAYKVAVRLSLINNVTSGLVSLASQFQALNKHIGAAQGGITALERQLLNLKRMGLIGGAMTAVGGFGLSLFAAPLEEAKKFQTEVAKFSALGFGDKTTEEAVKFAKGMNIMGMSARESMAMLREATVITGDLHHAMEASPFLAKMKSAVTSYMGGEHGAQSERMTMDLLKTAELRGALKDPETFKRVVDFATKAYIASGGLVKPSDLLGAIKTGGVAAKSLSDEAFFFQSLHTMQEMGGQRFGTSLMSAYQNLAQGRGSLRQAKVLEEMGLLDPKMIEYTKIGTIKQVKPGALKDSFTFLASQFDYFEKNIRPQLEGMSREKALEKIGSLSSNRTTANLFSTFFLEGNNIKKTVEMARKAMGVDALYELQAGTLQQRQNDLHAKWRDVLNELGTTILPIAIKGVTWLTDALKGAIAFTREFPLLTKGIVIAFGALSAVVAVGGVLTLATTGFRALGLALGGLSGALGAGSASGAAGAAAGAGGLIGKIGSLSGALRLLGLAAAPLLVMLAVKNWAEDTRHDKERVEKLKGWGDRVKGWMPEWMGDPTKKSRERYDTMRRELDGTGGDYVRPAGAGGGQPIADVYLDKEKVGKVLWSDMNRELRRPMAGTSRPDGRMSMTPVGASGR